MGHEMRDDDPAAIACRSIQEGHRIDTLPAQPRLPKNANPLEIWCQSRQKKSGNGKPSPWSKTPCA